MKTTTRPTLSRLEFDRFAEFFPTETQTITRHLTKYPDSIILPMLAECFIELHALTDQSPTVGKLLYHRGRIRALVRRILVVIEAENKGI